MQQPPRIRRLNSLFGQDLGRTQFGEPLYKWVQTKDLFYLIELPVEARTSAGIYTFVNGYRKVTWEQRIGSGWIVASWQPSGTEQQWKAKYGNALPYPPNGMYYPIPESLLPAGQEPTPDITMEAIRKLRESMAQNLEVPFSTVLQRTKDKADKQDREAREQSDQMIDSDWPAFDGAAHSKAYPLAVKERRIIL